MIPTREQIAEIIERITQNVLTYHAPTQSVKSLFVALNALFSQRDALLAEHRAVGSEIASRRGFSNWPQILMSCVTEAHTAAEEALKNYV